MQVSLAAFLFFVNGLINLVLVCKEIKQMFVKYFRLFKHKIFGDD